MKLLLVFGMLGEPWGPITQCDQSRSSKMVGHHECSRCGGTRKCDRLPNFSSVMQICRRYEISFDLHSLGIFCAWNDHAGGGGNSCWRLLEEIGVAVAKSYRNFRWALVPENLTIYNPETLVGQKFDCQFRARNQSLYWSDKGKMATRLSGCETLSVVCQLGLVPAQWDEN